MKEELQKIIDDCKHPWSRRFFENLFSKHEQIMESLNDRANGNVVDEIAGQYESVVDFDQALRGWDWNDEEEQIDELSEPTLNSYIDKASRQVRKPSRFDNIKTQTRQRQKRRQGIEKANSRMNTFNNSEHSNTTSEGILGNMVRSTIAKGLGVSPGMLPRMPKFGNKTKLPTKKFQTATMKAASAKLKPTPTVSATKPAWQPLEISHVFRGEPHPEHEHHLTQAVNHYNVATWAKHQGDHSKAEIHGRASNTHMKNYIQNTSSERLKRLNQDRVREIWK